MYSNLMLYFILQLVLMRTLMTVTMKVTTSHLMTLMDQMMKSMMYVCILFTCPHLMLQLCNQAVMTYGWEVYDHVVNFAD
jgi:sterol desaturase/sphingolipid hydroxylase (fatty acid hydroxylase superfamily)